MAGTAQDSKASASEGSHVRPVRIGHRNSQKVLLEEEIEQLCVSPKTPLLLTRVSDNAWVCGDNRAGQLGVLPRGPILNPTPIKGAVRWASVALSANHSIAIAADGKVYCWGLNNQGQLGRGQVSDDCADPEPVLSTFELDELSVVAVGAGLNHSIVAAGDALFVWGNNQYGQLGCGEVHEKPVCAPMMLRWLENVTVTQLTCGNNHSIVVTNQSTVYAWGCNEKGQLGLGDQKLRSRPVRVDRLWGIPIVNVAAGGEHSLAVTTNGMLFSWGSNSHGQLGHPFNVEDAEEMHKRRSASVRAIARAKLNQRYLNSLMEMGFTKARAELALLETGNGGVEVAIEWLLQADSNKEKEAQAAKEWDVPENAPQAAPVEDTYMSPVPKRVMQLSEIAAVAAGTCHTVVSCARGVYTFGCNDHGQLGLGSLQDAPVPVRVKSLGSSRDRIVQVAAGLSHTLFISESNRVWAAGLCDLGQFKPFMQPSPTGSMPTHSTFHSMPVRVQLPFLHTGDGPGPQPLLHEAKAGGHASVFLIRAQDEPIPEVPISLIEHLEGLLEHAEAEVRNAVDNRQLEGGKPTFFKPMRACIAMVYGNATALCAAFGLPNSVNYAKKLDVVTTRVLNLYNHETVEAIAEGAGCAQAPWMQMLLKRMQEWHIELREDMKKSFVKIVEDIQAHVKQLAISERAMLLLFSAQHPCLEEHTFAQLVLPKLCHSILSAAPISQQLLVRWWSSYPKDILADRVVKPLQSYITIELQATKKLTLAVMNSIKVLAKVEEASMVHLLLPPEVFYNQLISDKMDMQDHYLAWRQSHNNDHRSPAGMGPFSFCSFPFLLNAKAKTRLLQVEAKMQMEQTVAEARLEQVYQHYKKSRTQLEGELVALTQKDRLRMELLKQESEERKDRKERSPSGGVGRFVGWFRGRSARSSNGGSGLHGPAGSRPGSTAGLTASHALSLSLGGASSSSGLGSSQHGEPATEAERRMAAREISADNLSLPRAASLQLPAPVNCQFRDRHPDMCVVRVRRNHLVEDAMDEVSRQLKKDLFKPLRVHFIGEEGIDAGGVKKEFFQLLVTELLCPDYGLLTFHSESRTYWFNHWATAHSSLPEADLEQSLTDFRLLGVVLGLAIYNNVLLDFPLPIALYRKICGHEVGLADLEGFQPTIGKSLRQILEYSGPDSVKDTFCQVFAIDGQVAGEHYTVELVPGGADIDVTEENRREFVDKYVDYVLNKSIERQYAAFFEGLMMLCKGPAITLFSPVEMERLVCGNPHLDFKALENAAKYEAGFTVTTPAIIWLWDIAQNEFDLPAKKMFLKFFTGSDRAPIGGLGNMKCIIQRDGPDSNKLPTSHTCFNTLLLPEYATREKMLDRLKLAIMNAEGFGLE